MSSEGQMKHLKEPSPAIQIRVAKQPHPARRRRAKESRAKKEPPGGGSDGMDIRL